MSIIQLILNEHKVIVQYIQLINNIILNLKNKKEIGMDDINFIVEFYRNYIDKHHHKLEEIVFPLLMKNNSIETEGIIELIINEHDMGGDFITEIGRLIQNGDEFFSQSLDSLTSLLHRFAFSMTNHIEKENKFLQNLLTKQIDQFSIIDLNNETKNIEHIILEDDKKEFFEIKIEELLKYYKTPIYN
ncbi:MAG: hypothetical protein HeimC3_06520 [Candidatus Heimdallarchaeota archaeon LC_3]|nr:MAG: hypothetical protein HeimC3_06520 [Candidatus Heimdallarchaeota archaeon LC_3]